MFRVSLYQSKYFLLLPLPTLYRLCEYITFFKTFSGSNWLSFQTAYWIIRGISWSFVFIHSFVYHAYILFRRCSEGDSIPLDLKNRETDLVLPKPKKEFLKRSFKYNGAIHWNNLSIEAKSADSVYSFKRIIKSTARWSWPVLNNIYLFRLYIFVYLLVFVCFM